jgi:Holliday junction resolvase-like predicted endonuclease
MCAEVKARLSVVAGHAAEAVYEKKERKISQTACEFVVFHGLQNAQKRFDVVAIDFEDPPIRYGTSSTLLNRRLTIEGLEYRTEAGVERIETPPLSCRKRPGARFCWIAMYAPSKFSAVSLKSGELRAAA